MTSSLRLAVFVVLRDESPEVVRLFLVLDADEYHLGAGDLRLGVLDVVEELVLVPGDAGILVGVGIGKIRRGAGLAAVEPVEHGADLVLGAVADRMAGNAFVERGLAGGRVLRQRARYRSHRGDGNQRAQGQSVHGVLFIFFVRVCWVGVPRAVCGMAGLRWTSHERRAGVMTAAAFSSEVDDMRCPPA